MSNGLFCFSNKNKELYLCKNHQGRCFSRPLPLYGKLTWNREGGALREVG